MDYVDQRVRELILKVLGLNACRVTEDALLIDDLGADREGIEKLVVALMEEFGAKLPSQEKFALLFASFVPAAASVYRSAGREQFGDHSSAAETIQTFRDAVQFCIMQLHNRINVKHQIIEAGNVVNTLMEEQIAGLKTPDIYGHYSIVSDQYCESGKPKLISARRHTKAVREEPWDEVVGNRVTVVVESFPKFSVSEILARARSEIGFWDYHMLFRNCEHFVTYATEGQKKSAQVRKLIRVATAVAEGVAAYSVLKESPTSHATPAPLGVR